MGARHEATCWSKRRARADARVVTAEDPDTGEPDPKELKEPMERASRGDDSTARRLEGEDEMKRRAAHDDQRENDAGALDEVC